MKNEDMNLNEINTEEVLSEQELSELNETLKNNENIELPEKLSKDNIKDLLKKEVNKLEILEKETEKLKSENKNLFRKMIAVAAVFAIVVTSVFVAKPWQYINVKEEQIADNDSKQNVVVQDYSEIETLFVNYQKNYQKMQKLNYAIDMFGSIGATKEEAVWDYDAMPEGSMNTGAAPEYGTGFQELTDDSVLKEEFTSNSATREEHGETNEQVK
ncbi:MAG: hypothetical protein IJN49_08050, partial [Clostridia bacterium]|nr:hypothetical protein [Clostridia bacterium]